MICPIEYHGACIKRLLDIDLQLGRMDIASKMVLPMCRHLNKEYLRPYNRTHQTEDLING